MAVSLGLHMAVVAPPGFERPGNVPRPAATPLMVVLEPASVAAEAPFMPEPAVTVPERAPAPRPTIPTTVRAAAAIEPTARRQAASGAEPSHSEAATEPPAPRPSPLYYAAHELDVYPALRQPLDINWESKPEPGWLTVSLTLDEAGVVEDISMLDASLGREGEAAVRQALRLARFTAALKDGRAVKSRILVRVRLGADTLARRP
ncbi:MAG: energy transducer TonB [Betaproteobacteria bacterium]